MRDHLAIAQRHLDRALVSLTAARNALRADMSRKIGNEKDELDGAMRCTDHAQVYTRNTRRLLGRGDQ